MKMEGSRILVTGADGFIGSHLTEMLTAGGAKVRALSLYNSFNNWGWLEDIGCLDQVEVISGDIRDANFVREAMKDIDVVFHLAALIAIPYSYVAPDSYVQTNIIGTLNVVQAGRDLGVQRIVQTSTSEVYGTARSVPINEQHPLQPQSPYSATKIGSDALALSFFNTFSTPVVVARPFNTYGPRQSARAVIPTIITQILAGQKVIKLGSLHPTRDFNYVEDTCRGLMALGACDEAVGRSVNVGSNTEISIGDVADLIKTLTGMEVDIVADDVRNRPATSEVERLVCDNSLISRLTAFAPKYDIRSGLARTIEWFKDPSNLGKYKSGIYNV